VLGETSARVGIWRWMVAPRVRGWLLLLLAAVAAFELVLDFRILPPTAIDWIFSFGSDTTQYYLAFAYYRNASWHFPLTDMETMLHPVGASFLLADGIPLLAIPLKLVSSLLPVDFQFYGVWLFSCIVLSAVFAKLLLERLLTSRPLIWAGIALITLAPPLVARFMHCHLAAHWLVLASFWTVMEQRALPKRRIWLFSTLSLFVQPYLFAIVSGILLGAFWVHRRQRRELFLGAGAWFVAVALSAWVLGYFHLAESAASQEARYHADVTTFFSGMGTSSVVPDLPMGKEFRRVWKGRAEGYAYLGLGGMLLLVALLATLVAPWFRRAWPRRLHPSWVILGVLSLFMAGFAVSPSPNVLGHRHDGIALLTELIEPVTARLRSAGRFIWPLFYFILIFGLQAAEQWLARVPIKGAMFAGALLLIGAQGADLGPWLVEKGQKRAVTHPKPLPSVRKEIRARFSADTKIMAFDPPIQRGYCRGRGNLWPHRRPYYPLAVFGARNKLRVNTDFRASSRLTPAQIAAVCKFGAKIKRARKLPPHVVLVTPKDVYR
jgi:hypothetical protein